MTDNPKSTFARRVRAANPRAKRHDNRDDLIPRVSARSFILDHTTRVLFGAQVRRRSVR